MNALNIGRKRFPRRIAWAGTFATFATVAATSSPLHAQEAGTIAPTAEIKPDEHRVEGFNPSFSLNGNLSITQSDKVVGQLDGVAVLVGVGALGELDWIGGKHEITNRLTLSESFARTPASRRERAALTVVNRSSLSRTGTGSSQQPSPRPATP